MMDWIQFGDVNTQVLLLTLFLLGSLSVGFMVVTRRITPVIPFLYANARTQAKSAYLLDKQKILAIASADSLAQGISLIQDTDYYKELEKAYKVKDIHAALERGFLNMVNDIQGSSPKTMEPLFESYLSLWESKIVKALYRIKLLDQPFDSTIITPVGRITENLIEAMKDAESIKDFRVILGTTPFGKAFDVEHDSLEAGEAAIDTIVLKDIEEKVRNAKIPQKRELLQLFKTRFDIMNLLTIMKLTIREVPIEDRAKYLIPGTEVGKREKLVKAKTMEEFFDECKETKYGNLFQEAFEEYKKDQSVMHIEVALFRMIKTMLSKDDLMLVQGPYPLVSYFFKREFELKNISLAFKAIDAKFTQKEVEAILI